MQKFLFKTSSKYLKQQPPQTRIPLLIAGTIGVVIGSLATYEILEQELLSSNKQHHPKPSSSSSSSSKSKHHHEKDNPTIIVNDTNTNNSSNTIFPAAGIPKPSEHVVAYTGYAVSFNKMTKNPSWSCVRLNRELLNSNNNDEVVDRQSCQFHVDSTLPKNFRTHPDDFAKSGYDRGHLVAASDVKISQSAMNETFSLSNISPQVGEGFNRGFWAALEQFARDLTNTFDDVYSCTGPLFIPEFNSKSKQWQLVTKAIGPYNDILVPTHFFKCLLCVNNNKDTTITTTTTMREACFVVPNRPIDPSKEKLESFIVPRTRVERWSGLELFPALLGSSNGSSSSSFQHEYLQQQGNIGRLCETGEVKCELNNKKQMLMKINSAHKNNNNKTESD
jgi:endonuclease G